MTRVSVALRWQPSRSEGESHADVQGVGTFSIRKEGASLNYLSLYLNAKFICYGSQAYLRKKALEVVGERMRDE